MRKLFLFALLSMVLVGCSKSGIDVKEHESEELLYMRENIIGTWNEIMTIFGDEYEEDSPREYIFSSNNKLFIDGDPYTYKLFLKESSDCVYMRICKYGYTFEYADVFMVKSFSLNRIEMEKTGNPPYNSQTILKRD